MRVSQGVVSLREIRSELDRSPTRRFGRRVIANCEVHRGKIAVIIRAFAAECDSPFDQTDTGGVITILMGEHSQQMPGVRLLGISVQYFSVESLSLGQTTSLMQLQCRREFVRCHDPDNA